MERATMNCWNCPEGRGAILPLAMALCFAACSVETPQYNGDLNAFKGAGADSREGDSPGPQDAGTTDLVLGESFDAAGSWGMKYIVGLKSVVQPFGETQSNSITVGLVKLERHGKFPGWNMKVCDVRPDEVFGNKSVIPQAFIKSLAPRVDPGPVLTVERVGAEFRVGPITDLWGVTGLADPQHDPIPTSKDDPRIYDQDGDGQPGVSVKIEGLLAGEAYVAQRTIDRFTGVVESPNRIVGQTRAVVDKNIIGGSKPALANPVPSKPDPNPDFNKFELVRLPASIGDCETLLKQESAVFQMKFGREK
ncbi:MAG: hypothetical protein GMKNLPBB_00457 [Myxococcota bacterium]|nr:hypothetical protein [Myxococcota bacterium]